MAALFHSGADAVHQLFPFIGGTGHRHAPEHRLRAALTHKKTTHIAEPLGDGLPRRNDRGVIERGVFVVDLHIRELLLRSLLRSHPQ